MGLFSTDIGIDLGTANVIVYKKGKGIILREPSVVAVNQDTNKVIYVGAEAKKMLGRTPGNVVAIRPIRDGVIAKIEVTRNMLNYFIKKAVSNFVISKPSVVICAPCGVTQVEKRAIKDATIKAGAKEAFIIEEPMAAAIGAGLKVEEPMGNMIVDIGGGTTEVAVISFGGIVSSKSVKIAGDEFDSNIVNYIKKKHKLMIGERTAEEIKMTVGAVHNDVESLQMEVRGRDILSGLPKNIMITTEEVVEALSESVQTIVEAVKYCLEKTPPELAADVYTNGIYLAGGGALLRGLDKVISEATHINVYIADNPLDCVALGTGSVLDQFDKLKDVLK